MAQRTFHSLVQRLATSVPGCPFPVIEKYVRDAAIDACERSLAWRFVQPPVTLTPGVYDYPYETMIESEVHAYLVATMNGRDMPVYTLMDVTRRYPQWPDMDSADRSTPRCLFQLDVDNFAVLPVPDDQGPYVLNMVLVLKPTRDAQGMDKTAMDDLENVIMHGALRDLLVLPNKNWSDRELATYHAKQYAYMVSERRARADLGAGRAPLSVQMRPLA